MSISKTLEMSLVAFNGSVNCDRSNAKNFYDSYVNRKKLIITGKLHALKDGDKNVNRSKLKKEADYLREALNKESEACRFIDGIFYNYVTLKEAEDLLGDLNLG